MKNNYLKSPINYIGNKHKILPQLIPLFPNEISTYVDLFGGSGTVTLNTQAEHYIYNDINNYVASILDGISKEDIDNVLCNIDSLISEFNLSKTNLSGFQELRDKYNKGMTDWKVLYTLMCYSFNYQFRFNNSHQYNSSFGKDRSSFSDRQRKNLIETSKLLKDIDIAITTKSFMEFDFSKLTSKDFVYLDPPYFNSVGNYNDGKRGFEGWTVEHESYMKELLIELNDKGIRWALSNNMGVNSDLGKWVIQNGFIVHELDNTYKNSNYQKKDKGTDIEVLITNY